MVDPKRLLNDPKRLLKHLEEDLRERATTVLDMAERLKLEYRSAGKQIERGSPLKPGVKDEVS